MMGGLGVTHTQINCFITVVEEGSYSKAAAVLFISQPAISKSIAKLEEEFGVSLLERKSNGLRPTAAGTMLYDFLKKTKEEFTELVANINSSIKEPVVTVRLGCPETWDPDKFYSRIVDHFAANYPSVNLVLECHRLPSLVSKLQAEKLDIIMTHEFYPSVQYGLSVQHLTDTSCGILYSKTFFKDINSLNDLRDIDFLHFDSDIEKKFGAVIKKACAEYGFTPNLKNCGQYSSALFDLACGKGVMFFTSWDSVINSSSYTFLPIKYVSPINIIYPTVTTNPYTHIFAHDLVELFAEK